MSEQVIIHPNGQAEVTDDETPETGVGRVLRRDENEVPC